MSTNQERRAEARQRLRDQMEAQARREKQLKIAGAVVVVVLILGLVGVVVWKKAEERAAEQHAADWTSCEYPAGEDLPEKVDPKQVASQGADMMKQAEEYNKKIDEAKGKEKKADPPTGEQPKSGTTPVTLTTNRGEIPLTIDHAKAPCNAASFVSLARDKYFDGTNCHRLVASDDPKQGSLAVLQCGDPTGTGLSGPGYTVKDEPPTDLAPGAAGASGQQAVVYPRGTVAMAKSQQPDSAGSQFFLVYKDSQLPPDYSVMGTIGEPGLQVLDAIAKDGVKNDDPKSEDNQVPKKPVTIDTAVAGEDQNIPTS